MQTRFARRTLAALLLTAACASGASSSSSSPAPGNRSFITEAEIPATGTETAFDLIQRIRPEYFRQKPSQTYTGGQSVAPPPTVVENGQRFGFPEDLKSISASSLSMVRYYSIEEGKRKYGMQYGGGVIEITLRNH